jgi:predicted DNA-binding transcriptional regulator AlpA
VDRADVAQAERLLSWPKVRQLAGDMGRTTAWRLEKVGQFPAPVQVSPGRVAWRESDILAWQAQRAPKAEAA